jgi:hypothetical protein
MNRPAARGSSSRRAQDASGTTPCYELRVRLWGPDDTEMEVWQVPSRATPHLKTPVRIAGLRGRAFPLDEDLALYLGLLSRVLAPMRSRDNMRACAEGIEAMGREEAAYWLGMTMHRKNPRRVLMALRCLLVEPR